LASLKPIQIFMICCKSRKATQRVKRIITDLLRLKLKRKVNQDKSAVSRPWFRKSVLRRFVWISTCFCLQINSPISDMKELIWRQKHEWLQSVNYLKAIPVRIM
jgi:hypothetical protein